VSQRVKKEKSVDNRSKTGTTPGARAAHISLGAARPRQFLTDSLAAGPDNIGPARASTNYLRMFLYHGALRTEIQRSGSSCPEIERPRREPLLISVSKASSTRREIYNKMRLPSIEAHCVFFDDEKNEGPRAFPPNNGAASIVPISGFVLNRGKSTASSPRLSTLALLVDIIDRKNFVFQSPPPLFFKVPIPMGDNRGKCSGKHVPFSSPEESD